MALQVEDGTGLANAESYVSVAAFRSYAALRGIDVTGLTDEECEQALRKAFTYVNAWAKWKSAPVSQAQAGEFPRTALSDGMGRVTSVVPPRVKDAQCEAAILSGGNVDLFVTADRGGQVQSEAVGPISTTYFAGAPPGTYFEAVERLLLPFKRNAADLQPEPSWNDYAAEGRQDPIFGVGMDDNPDARPATDLTE